MYNALGWISIALIVRAPPLPKMECSKYQTPCMYKGHYTSACGHWGYHYYRNMTNTWLIFLSSTYCEYRLWRQTVTSFVHHSGVLSGSNLHNDTMHILFSMRQDDGYWSLVFYFVLQVDTTETAEYAWDDNFTAAAIPVNISSSGKPRVMVLIQNSLCICRIPGTPWH